MWGGIIGLIIQLISGAVGGNVAGAALKQYNLGTLGNSIAGIIGGGVGAQIIGALVGGGAGTDMAGAGGLDVGSIIGQIASGGVGGGILMVIVGLIKKAMGGAGWANSSEPISDRQGPFRSRLARVSTA